MEKHKSQYVIKCVAPLGCSKYTYYVALGGTYQVQGKKHACVTTCVEEAKRYSSVKVAENAYNKLFESCVNLNAEHKVVKA